MNRSSTQDILAHLQRCDAVFLFRLSQRVDLVTYATKIEGVAERFEAWYDGQLIGLVAAYFDNNETGAFITNVSVEGRFQRQGLAKKLVRTAIHTAADLGHKKIRLEVARDNVPALNMYMQMEFLATDQLGGATILLSKTLV